MAQHTGTVNWFNSAKGYGFLTYKEGPDVFCHYTSIQIEGYKEVRQDDRVEFDIVEGNTGKPQAANVKVLLPIPLKD
jgi:CspA family cold shock protein